VNGMLSESDNRRLRRLAGLKHGTKTSSWSVKEKLAFARELWPDDSEFVSNGAGVVQKSAHP
jgi:hypothetical protein